MVDSALSLVRRRAGTPLPGPLFPVEKTVPVHPHGTMGLTVQRWDQLPQTCWSLGPTVGKLSMELSRAWGSK